MERLVEGLRAAETSCNEPFAENATATIEDPRAAAITAGDGRRRREADPRVALPDWRRSAADDPLARFILVVAMGLNDNSLANTRFVNTDEEYELLY